ncbi:hypothetical protein [Phaeodactylibacter sp.]|uniref:hypothetical protein n=1 Tax=Phaeodactylibacter sp. TaxID=1940289 RepID=UPI0025FCDBA7|nr:hypothetical protein [Phaeodactylibacter sp.]MCI5056707.1 hypothetical protein [Flavobacteriales bacterium]MCI5093498.1 hypothetical protein [Phaeodactylibacter sp.]
MTEKLLSTILIIGLGFFQLHAQHTSPLLSGKVEISITEGTFECDLTLSDIPTIEDYFIRINAGMNILHIRSKKPYDFLIYFKKSLKDTLSSGETAAYYFEDNSGKGKFLPEEIQFRYVGKFPVASDTLEYYSRKDWKGNIAFNGKSVRTDAFQSAWYPIIYDIAKDKLYHKVRYDFELSCADCSTLHVNGNPPVKGSRHRFKSELPVGPALYSGNFEFISKSDTYLLNADLLREEADKFEEVVSSYKAFYEQNLNIPFEQVTTFVETTPTSLKDGFMYVSYPTIYSIGWGEGLRGIFDPEKENHNKKMIAHELGHYYSGTLKVFNSPIGNVLSEGLAEFLSMKVLAEFIGEKEFNADLKRKYELSTRLNPTPISQIGTEEDLGNRYIYAYRYFPLLLHAIEKEIGQKRMWQWLQNVFKSEIDYTDYEYLLLSLANVVSEEELKVVRKKLLESSASLKNIRDNLGIE